MARKDAAKSGFEAWPRAAVACVALVLAGTLALPGGALALSELPREDVPVPEGQDGADTIERHDLPPPGQTQKPDAQQPQAGDGEEADDDESQPAGETPRPPAVTVPLPDPVVIPRDPDRDAAQGTEGAKTDEEPVPEVLYDVSVLPEPVRRMRDLILEACLSGEIERLRPLLSTGENGTQLSFGSIPGDPIAFLRELSGDEEGHEILAILYEVLSAGYVKLGQSAEDEMYVWPYFFAVPLADLSPRQRVELFKIVTAGDYEDMKNYNAYIFYRIGISPEGRWLFFVAGD